MYTQVRVDRGGKKEQGSRDENGWEMKQWNTLNIVNVLTCERGYVFVCVLTDTLFLLAPGMVILRLTSLEARANPDALEPKSSTPTSAYENGYNNNMIGKCGQMWMHTCEVYANQAHPHSEHSLAPVLSSAGPEQQLSAVWTHRPRSGTRFENRRGMAGIAPVASSVWVFNCIQIAVWLQCFLHVTFKEKSHSS